MFKDGEVGNKVTLEFYVSGAEVPGDFWDWTVLVKMGAEKQGIKVKLSLNDEELEAVFFNNAPSA